MIFSDFLGKKIWYFESGLAKELKKWQKMTKNDKKWQKLQKMTKNDKK